MRSRRRIRIRPDGSDGPDESNWLLTYGDIMTLLMSFFVFIFSITYMDDALFRDLLDSLSDSLGRGSSRPAAEAEAIPDLRREIELRGLARDLEVVPERREIRIYGAEAVVFEEGSAEIPESVVPLLRSLAGLLVQLRHDVRVEGYAARDEGADGEDASGWALSTARALEVVRFFQRSGIDPRRLSAAGFGDARPRYPPGARNRPRNRRVEIVLVPRPELRRAPL